MWKMFFKTFIFSFHLNIFFMIIYNIKSKGVQIYEDMNTFFKEEKTKSLIAGEKNPV